MRRAGLGEREVVRPELVHGVAELQLDTSGQHVDDLLEGVEVRLDRSTGLEPRHDETLVRRAAVGADQGRQRVSL